MYIIKFYRWIKLINGCLVIIDSLGFKNTKAKIFHFDCFWSHINNAIAEIKQLLQTTISEDNSSEDNAAPDVPEPPEEDELLSR